MPGRKRLGDPSARETERAWRTPEPYSLNFRFSNSENKAEDN